MKTCFRCHRSFELDQFYRHPMMADGHLGKCKDCTRKDVSEHREKNIESIRAYDRARSNQPHRKALRQRIEKNWSLRYPDRKLAHGRAAKAKIERPDACQLCGASGVRIEKHHPDYSKPLFVTWLCKPCHALADKQRRKNEAS